MSMNSAPLKAWIVQQFVPDITPAELDDDYDLIDSGLVDSLRLLRLIAWVCDANGIPPGEVQLTPDNFRSVNAIQAFVESAAAPHNSSKRDTK